MDKAKVKRLARVTLGPGDLIDESAAELAMTRLTRSELKEYLSELKREIAARRVLVSVSGPAGRVDDELRRRYAGSQTVVTSDESLGGGMKIRAGDDLIDASVKGLVSGTIDRLKEK